MQTKVKMIIMEKAQMSEMAQMAHVLHAVRTIWKAKGARTA